MTNDNMTFWGIEHPCYIMEESRLRRNLRLISRVAREADVEIILAFKAFALWRTFPIFREYIQATTASSLCEARLALEEFGSEAHTYSPAYTDYEFDDIVRCSSHLTFNSLSQYEHLHQRAKTLKPALSLGLRVNPEYSEVGTALYNPCAPGTRFGVPASKLPAQLPADIEGFHCHCHCESGADVFERTLREIEKRFAPWFHQLRWINFGGGHLMTRADYDLPHLIYILKELHSRYPHLHVILEPGSAFAWQTGPLVAHVVDVVEDHDICTAILDVSFTCHMPDCLEMPYMPQVRGAEAVDPAPAPADSAPVPADSVGGSPSPGVPVPADSVGGVSYPSAPVPADSVGGSPSPSAPGGYLYRLGGNSCLSGDYMGLWRFSHELRPGDTVIFEDMIHYTTVKTTVFNGISHPSIALLREDGTLEMLRQFGYEDYRNRMD